MMEASRAEQIAGEIMNLFEGYGSHEYAGEKVTQLEHMVQAARLAEEQGYGEEVVLAAFLHDIGHICVSAAESGTMGAYGIRDHETLGAAFLEERGFSQKLIRLVESHVEAKRYLTFKYPDYCNSLSEASRKTLEYQGGVMNAREAEAFEKDPLFPLMLQMRHWDDEAKVENKPVGDIEKFRSMIYRHLLNSEN